MTEGTFTVIAQKELDNSRSLYTGITCAHIFYNMHYEDGQLSYSDKVTRAKIFLTVEGRFFKRKTIVCDMRYYLVHPEFIAHDPVHGY